MKDVYVKVSKSLLLDIFFGSKGIQYLNSFLLSCENFLLI